MLKRAKALPGSSAVDAKLGVKNKKGPTLNFTSSTAKGGPTFVANRNKTDRWRKAASSA